jgi:hypothetical protein
MEALPFFDQPSRGTVSSNDAAFSATITWSLAACSRRDKNVMGG